MDRSTMIDWLAAFDAVPELGIKIRSSCDVKSRHAHISLLFSVAPDFRVHALLSTYFVIRIMVLQKNWRPCKLFESGANPAKFAAAMKTLEYRDEIECTSYATQINRAFHLLGLYMGETETSTSFHQQLEWHKGFKQRRLIWEKFPDL